jgi:hypothetical protein
MVYLFDSLNNTDSWDVSHGSFRFQPFVNIFFHEDIHKWIKGVALSNTTSGFEESGGATIY